MATILSISKDPLLLKTREQILKTAGYDVISCSCILEAFSSFDESAFPDLVLAGHTLSEREIADLETYLKRRHPHIPIVVISSDLCDVERVRPKYYVVSFADPAQLTKVCRLALESEEASKATAG